MHDRHDGTLRILIVDDRRADPSAWNAVAGRLDSRVAARCVDSASSLQTALLEGDWVAVLAHQSPEKLSISAVLAMVQVLDPPPAVLLYPEVRSDDDRSAWLAAAIRAARTPLFPCFEAGRGPRPGNPEFSDASAPGSITLPSHLGGGANFSSSDVEALRALRDSEERFRTLTEIAPVGIFLTDAAQECVYVNERWSDITGLAADDALGRDWRLCLQTDSAALQATAVFAADPLMPLAFESRIDKPGGPATWVIGQMRPYRDGQGEIIGHLGVITDITDRKSAELAVQESEKRLRELSAHMVSAEERQRALIAREIHDDIGSSLTGMKIDVMRLKELTAGNAEAQEKLAAFNRLLDSAAASSVRIAKALRPSILDDGIVPAIDWQLREFGKRMGIDTEFNEPEHEPKLTPGQSIALFRVVQEALNNVAKHAEARHVDVVLFSRAGELTLEIRDDGKGLPGGTDQRGHHVVRSGAFGIIGMRERILSLGGWMDVTGAPGKGTTVMVGIPMETTGREA